MSYVFNLHSNGVLIIKDFDLTEDSLRFPNSMKPKLLSFDVDRQSIYYDDVSIARFAGDSLEVVWTCLFKLVTSQYSKKHVLEVSVLK